LPLPLAFGVPWLAQPQEYGDGKKEQLKRKTIGQRQENQVSVDQGSEYREERGKTEEERASEWAASSASAMSWPGSV
jgi:hypothetical protein